MSLHGAKRALHLRQSAAGVVPAFEISSFLRLLCLALAVVWLAGCTRSPQEKFLLAVAEGKGTIPLPGGVLELENPIVLGPRINGLKIIGKPGDVLRPLKGNEPRALIICRECKNVTIEGFTIEGDSALRERPSEAPPVDSDFRQYFNGTGIVNEGGEGMVIRNMKFKELTGFAVLTAFDKKTVIENNEFADSGTRNSKGYNTGAGGVAITDGSNGVQIRNNVFKRIYGTGVYVYAALRAERPQNTVIEKNQFENISRAAVLVARAYNVRVVNNQGKMIGFPANTVNLDMRPPAGVGTAGKVDSSLLEENSFEQVNGRCFDLDGFHDSEVARNTCRNRGDANDYPNGGYGLVLDNSPAEVRSSGVSIHDNVIEGMRWGGAFVIGVGHKLTNNKFLRLNLLGCSATTLDGPCMPNNDEPLLGRAGIYLGLRGVRPDPASGIVIQGNEISGQGMSANCVMYGPQVKPASSTVQGNACRDN